MSLHEKLKIARCFSGLSQIEAARKVGISNTALSNYETGYRQPDLDTLANLASLYGVTIDELADGKRVIKNTALDLWSITKLETFTYKGKPVVLTEGKRRQLRKLLQDMFEE